MAAETMEFHAQQIGLHIEKESENERVVALSGNPNVGKSTVFNALTGMRQHTGNWPGKTVANAQGHCTQDGEGYVLVDLPGTYSLMAHSAEEEVARDFLCFGGADAAVVVCDATCLERNLNLVLQTLEITTRAVVCVNLMDEAKKKGIEIDLRMLENLLGVPVAGATARDGKGLAQLMQSVAKVCGGAPTQPVCVKYDAPIERAVALLLPPLTAVLRGALPPRFVALKLLEGDEALLAGIDGALGFPLAQHDEVCVPLMEAKTLLEQAGYDGARLRDRLVACLYQQAEQIAASSVRHTDDAYQARQLKLDRVLTGKWTGVPIMLSLLALVFYLTIAGANVPSRLLSDALFWVQDRLTDWFMAINAPAWLHGAVVLGAYRVLAWVVSVMLPPMAIFFPLFTLLEDFGYLPRVAFNLDHQFRRCCACGKQSLTMW